MPDYVTIPLGIIFGIGVLVGAFAFAFRTPTRRRKRRWFPPRSGRTDDASDAINLTTGDGPTHFH